MLCYLTELKAYIEKQEGGLFVRNLVITAKGVPSWQFKIETIKIGFHQVITSSLCVAGGISPTQTLFVQRTFSCVIFALNRKIHMLNAPVSQAYPHNVIRQLSGNCLWDQFNLTEKLSERAAMVDRSL